MAMLLTAVMLFCFSIQSGASTSIDDYIDLTNCEMDLVMSPGYDRTDSRVLYAPNLHHVTLVTAKASQQIHVLVNYHHLQDEAIGGCIDYVEFYDGDIRDTPAPALISRTCGWAYVPMFTTSGNQLTVIFHSDGTTEARGYKAVLTPDCVGCDLDPEQCVITGSGDCLAPMDYYCGFAIHGLSETIYNVTCGSDNFMCGVPCQDCPDRQEQTCEDALSGETNCYLNRHTPCSETVGVGYMISEYICDGSGDYLYDYVRCIEPCCCASRQGNRPSPLHCHSPGVFFITEGREIYCDELPYAP